MERLLGPVQTRGAGRDPLRGIDGHAVLGLLLREGWALGVQGFHESPS